MSPEESIRRPFSLTGGDFEGPAPDLAEDHAVRAEDSARYFRQSGRRGLAREERKAAAWWRGLANLSTAESQGLCDQMFLEVRDKIDALLVLAQEDGFASNYLTLLSDAISSGLLEGAARGQRHAASAVMASLGTAVNNFEFVAIRRPELFRALARRSLAIPGLISRNKAQSRENDRLLKLLQQGEASFLARSLDKKPGRYWTYSNANALAVRAIDHIQSARAYYLGDCRVAKHLRQEFPLWRKRATKLKSFSPATWKAWAEIAWQMIAEISPQNKPGLNPAFYEPKTKICNVRKQRKNPYYGTVDKAPSIREQDIKEALFSAIELIATGSSRRTKERRRS